MTASFDSDTQYLIRLTRYTVATGYGEFQELLTRSATVKFQYSKSYFDAQFGKQLVDFKSRLLQAFRYYIRITNK